MKTKKIILSLSVAALALWATGCSEEKKSAIEQTKDAATKTADALKETGAKAVADVAEKAKEVTAPASAKAQELIASAQKLATEGKFQDALAKLKEVGGEKLSVAQQSVVDGLKAQIEKALAAAPKTGADAAGAAGTLINK